MATNYSRINLTTRQNQYNGYQLQPYQPNYTSSFYIQISLLCVYNVRNNFNRCIFRYLVYSRGPD